jgi:hypothetical protein
VEPARVLRVLSPQALEPKRKEKIMKIANTLAAFLLAGGTAVAGLATPAQSDQLYVLGGTGIDHHSTSAVVDVQFKGKDWKKRHHDSDFDGRHGIYNGYEGSRHRRFGWHQFQGWWFPPAAFAAGLIIGSQYPHDPVPVARTKSLPRVHYQWCDDRYQTYRWSDNSYVPRVGYRAQCMSPYWP